MALITFEGVGLSYGGANVAHDVSFSVNAGEFWASWAKTAPARRR